MSTKITVSLCNCIKGTCLVGPMCYEHPTEEKDGYCIYCGYHVYKKRITLERFKILKANAERMDKIFAKKFMAEKQRTLCNDEKSKQKVRKVRKKPQRNKVTRTPFKDDLLG